MNPLLRIAVQTLLYFMTSLGILAILAPLVALARPDKRAAVDSSRSSSGSGSGSGSGGEGGADDGRVDEGDVTEKIPAAYSETYTPAASLKKDRIVYFANEARAPTSLCTTSTTTDVAKVVPECSAV